MGKPYTRAPHVDGTSYAMGPEAPHAALLIDFDNVTMGMRSDLSKELKSLLNSDIIKGKVAVQRAYADWRRYPQYIVPLSEASIDLIFAPAYGSSKKNATDIRLAIDALELVFIRPEIGTYILLSGDSDFSSLVLKLKEYGKYVIGVGIQESSSDILVQNCDEYYSYTTLSGLRKTTELDGPSLDPWVLVEKSLERMIERKDVMRSDRLKQVMQEVDPGFQEKNYGFTKFSKFLSEAASRGLVKLKRLENGQYEVQRSAGTEAGGRAPRKPDERRRQEPAGRGRGKRPRGGDVRPDRGAVTEPTPPEPEREEAEGDPLKAAYGLLRAALDRITGGESRAVRDSDVKRKMLALDPSFDEGELGFGKFSRFLRQAHHHDVIELSKRETGNYEVTLKDGPPARETSSEQGVPAGRSRPSETPQEERVAEVASPQAAPDESETGGGVEARRGRLGLRVGSARGRKSDEPPALLEGQIAGAGKDRAKAGAKGGRTREETEKRPRRKSRAPAAGTGIHPSELGLPTDRDAVVRYLTNSYQGVGKRTAEALADAFGERLFEVLHSEPERVRDTVQPARAEKILEAWRADYDRRTGRAIEPAGNGAGEPSPAGEEASGATAGAGAARPRRRTRRGGGRRKPADD